MTARAVVLSVGSLMIVGVATGAGACAHSTDSSDVATLNTTGSNAGDGGPSEASTDGALAIITCVPEGGACPMGEVCSANVCVPAKTDADKDGYTADVDCDDHDPNVHPGAPHTCDGKDDACDGKIDDVPALLTGSLTAPINSHWALAGTATISNGWAVLTQDMDTSAGDLWWNAPYVFDSFDMTATIWIQDKPTGADGIAFAWVPGNDVTMVGAEGPGFGVQGLSGYAVAVKTYQDTGDPPVPYLALVQETDGTHLARASIPDVRDGNPHTLRVKLDAGNVSVWLDGINYMNLIELNGYVAFSGHWGFGAATYAASEAHWVQNITMSFPNGQGCVP